MQGFNSGTSQELSQLDLIVLINTFMMFKMALDEDKENLISKKEFQVLETKINRILELLEDGI